MFRVEIKKQRKRLGMSQSQLAGVLNVIDVTISRWETGVVVPRMPAAVLAFLKGLEPLPKEERRFNKDGRPPKKKKEKKARGRAGRSRSKAKGRGSSSQSCA